MNSIDPLTTVAMRAPFAHEHIANAPWSGRVVFCKLGTVGRLGTSEVDSSEIPFPATVSRWNGDSANGIWCVHFALTANWQLAMGSGIDVPRKTA